MADRAHGAPLYPSNPSELSGYDVEAEYDGSRLLVQVVEYPDPDRWPEIARGRNEEPTSQFHEAPDVLPESWGFSTYSMALLTASHLRKQHPQARIAQLYPLIGLFRTLEDPDDPSLGARSLHAYESKYLRDRRIELWLLREDGAISLKGHRTNDP